jgi:tetratricopeptide (TPR) repeat protein
VLLMLSLCATTLQADESEHWCETTSPTFQLISNLPADAQADLVTSLARFEAVAEPFLPGDPVTRRGSLKLVVFRQRGEFLELTGKRQFAGYMQPSLQTNRLLIGPVQGSLTETALHEYTHYLLRNRTGVSLPIWFDEGLATLLGHTELDAGQVVAGTLPVRRLEGRLAYRVQSRSPQQKLTRTINANSLESFSGERINEFYDLSWLLSHYLYFGVYSDELAAGRIRNSGLTRFLQAGDQTLFEHLDLRPTQLVRRLEKHLRSWDRPAPKTLPESVSPSIGFRCLTALERDLELARAIHVQNPATARRLLAPHAAVDSELSRAALAELNIVRARTEIAADAHDVAEQLIEEALTLSPGNAEAMVIAADLTVGDCLFGRKQACQERWQTAAALYRSALRQDPGRYDGILGIGLARLHAGQPGDAVNYLRVAYERVPWASVVNYFLGESYRQVGDSRARIYLQNARNWAGTDLWRRLAEESLRLEAESRSGVATLSR